MLEKIDLEKGNYYQITQVSTGKALMMKHEQSRDYQNRIPLMGIPNDEDLNQVWMIEYIDKKQSYEIVHSLSTLVLENFTKDIRLTFGDWKSGQLFCVERL